MPLQMELLVVVGHLSTEPLSPVPLKILKKKNPDFENENQPHMEKKTLEDDHPRECTWPPLVFSSDLIINKQRDNS